MGGAARAAGQASGKHAETVCWQLGRRMGRFAESMQPAPSSWTRVWIWWWEMRRMEHGREAKVLLGLGAQGSSAGRWWGKSRTRQVLWENTVGAFVHEAI